LIYCLEDFDFPKDSMPVAQWLEIDQYALSMMRNLQEEVLQDFERYEFHLAAQKLHTFCSEQLGGFYLDILKDRLYTAEKNSVARHSAQNALRHITHSLVRLMAPILTFTAEEAWVVLSGKDDESIYIGEWYSLPASQLNEEEVGKWLNIESWRARVNKQLEEARAAGHIGSALEAEVDIYLAGDDYKVLSQLGDDLRFVFITSRATVHHVSTESEQRIDVASSTHNKCQRCWHYRSDLGVNQQHPTLCGRCVSNLFGDGEARQYA
jgi:isoleucyl-tRNA synthetase